ncbi:MAG: hypothetical protein KA792_03155 [Bacteroidales bacterium]|nr:hypothetical protein [Bacteroidales bacterium]
MIYIKNFSYSPNESEAEKASNSYLMSLFAIIGGILPLVNFIATLFFYFANRKSTYFVRWHCIQALVSQSFIFVINTVWFVWTMFIIFSDFTITNNYIAYIITIILFNVAEFYATVYSAVRIRNGIHIEWWFFGSLTNLICKQDE